MNVTVPAPLISIPGVIYLDDIILAQTQERANKLFSQNSFAKQLWVLRHYKQEGGRVNYIQGKPDNVKSYEQAVTLNFDKIIVQNCFASEISELENIKFETDKEKNILELKTDLENYLAIAGNLEKVKEFVTK